MGQEWPKGVESPRGHPPSEDHIGLTRDRDKWDIILNVPQCQHQGSGPEFCNGTTWPCVGRKHCWQGWGLGSRCRWQSPCSEGDALWIPSHWIVLKGWWTNGIMGGGLFENEFGEKKTPFHKTQAPIVKSFLLTCPDGEVFSWAKTFKRGMAFITSLTGRSFWGIKLLAASRQGPDSAECNSLSFFPPASPSSCFSSYLSLLLLLYLTPDLDRREVPWEFKEAWRARARASNLNSLDIWIVLGQGFHMSLWLVIGLMAIVFT